MQPYQPLTPEQYQAARQKFSPDQIIAMEQRRKSEAGGGNNTAAPTSTATPPAPDTNTDNGQPQNDGFFKSLVKDPIKTLLVKPAVNLGKAAGAGLVYAFGSPEQKAKADELLSKDTTANLGPLGTYNVEAQKPFGQGGAKQILGEGAKAASYLLGAEEAPALKSTLGTITKKAAIAGGKAGALYGGGTALEKNEGVGDVAKEALIGGATGAATGALIAPVAKGLTSLGTRPTQEEATRAAGTVVQGTKKEAKNALETLSMPGIDTSKVKTYDDLNNLVQKEIDTRKNAVDTAFKSSSASVPVKKFEQNVVAEYNGRKISAKHNPVSDALDQLQELYTKTRNPNDLVRVKALTAKAKGEGLTPFEVNSIAREYGTEFKAKGFNKFGEPLTSVNDQAFENTRKGVKSAARGLLPGKDAQLKDEEMSHLISVQKNVSKMQENVNKLTQRVQDKNFMQKFARIAAKGVDIATLGGPKEFVTKLFFPSNVGMKTLNSLDLQEALAKNLKTIRDFHGASDNVLINKLARRAHEIGLAKPLTVFGRIAPPAVVAGGENAFSNNEQQ